MLEGYWRHSGHVQPEEFYQLLHDACDAQVKPPADRQLESDSKEEIDEEEQKPVRARRPQRRKQATAKLGLEPPDSSEETPPPSPARKKAKASPASRTKGCRGSKWVQGGGAISSDEDDDQGAHCQCWKDCLMQD